MLNRLCVLQSCSSSGSVMMSLGNNLLDGSLCFGRNVCFFFTYWEVVFVFVFLKPISFGCYRNAHLVQNQDALLFPAILITTYVFHHLQVING